MYNTTTTYIICDINTLNYKCIIPTFVVFVISWWRNYPHWNINTIIWCPNNTVKSKKNVIKTTVNTGLQHSGSGTDRIILPEFNIFFFKCWPNMMAAISGQNPHQLGSWVSSLSQTTPSLLFLFKSSNGLGAYIICIV